MNHNILDEFNNIKSPVKSDEDYFHTKKIKGTKHYLAKNFLGEAFILFDVINKNRQLEGPNTINLKLEFNKKCIILNNEIETQGQFTILRCKKVEEIKIILFFELIDSLFKHLPSKPSDDEIIEYIIEIVELYSEIGKGQNEVVGLWGELFIINQSKNKTEMIQAWHPTNNSRYDFVDENEILEIKATKDGVRKHNFSYGQLNDSPKSLFIASILMAELPLNGVSVIDLKNMIFDNVTDHDLKIKVEHLIIKTLGEKYEYDVNRKFDLDYSKRNIKFYNALEIPKIKNPPKELSQIEFICDLTHQEEKNISNSLILKKIR